MRILLIGGAGYVGSHVARECTRAHHEPIIFDSYVTGHPEAVAGLTQIEGDLLDRHALQKAFEQSRFDAVFHFAAPETTGLSLADPMERYRDRIDGTLNLLEVMQKKEVANLIFCSSAAVYGDPVELPIREAHPTRPIDPWGRAMGLIEETLAAVASQNTIRYIALRTFNAGGADPWGDIGEDRPGHAHLIPRLLLTALGHFDAFEIYGTDFGTQDGTCVRDFVHVNDIATAHVLALEALHRCPNQIINLGAGAGYSVRDIVEEVQRITETRLVVMHGDRRPGDPPALVASNEKARALLQWKPIYSDIHTILETAWYWHKRHPQGYARRDADFDRDHDPDLSPEI